MRIWPVVTFLNSTINIIINVEKERKFSKSCRAIKYWLKVDLKFWQRRLINSARKHEKQMGYSSNRLLLCRFVKNVCIFITENKEIGISSQRVRSSYQNT